MREEMEKQYRIKCYPHLYGNALHLISPASVQVYVYFLLMLLWQVTTTPFALSIPLQVSCIILSIVFKVPQNIWSIVTR